MVKGFRQALLTSGCILMASLVAGCGGGGGGGSSTGGGTGTGGGGSGGGGGNGGSGSSGPTYTAGVFEPSSTFADRCAMPRPGTSDRAGSTVLENFWLRSWSNELYLWYDEIQDRNPYNYGDKLAYFDLLKTNALTPSGNPKDQFHYTYDTAEYEQLVNSGAEVQYGAEIAIIRSTPPREVRISYVNEGTSAAQQGLYRGLEIIQVDGISVEYDNDPADIDTINEGLFPDEDGETHVWRVQDSNTANRFDVTLTAGVVSVNPVQTSTILDVGGDKVGYLHLTTFGTVSAEEQLINAMTDFANEGVDDLVVDLRYNGGGFLDISAELGYMIAGPNQIGSDFYEDIVFNDKHPTTNPVTGAPLTPTPFHSTAQGFSVADGQPLPNLDLQRVFVLTTGNTCSASESLINGLRGIDVEVVMIGKTTCGKPYGFYGFDNCGTTYFSIQFRGENAKGFGDYADGFKPSNGGAGVQITGCSVADDYSSRLGDPNEDLLETALTYRATGQCFTDIASSPQMAERAVPAGAEEPQLFSSGRLGNEYIDPTSLYSSPRLIGRLQREQLRALSLNRPLTPEEKERLQ